jgi:hypothetical protein
MNKNDIEVGQFYVAKISGNLSIIKVTNVYSPGGWYGVIIRTNSQVIIRTATHFIREATKGEIASKKVGVRLIKFEIPDTPRVDGFDEIVKMLMAGSTLPNVEPIPEVTAEVLGRIARGELDEPLPPKEEWCDRIKVIRPPIAVSFSTRDLAKVILDLTSGKTVHDIQVETALPEERCTEILEIRAKLLDILE